MQLHLNKPSSPASRNGGPTKQSASVAPGLASGRCSGTLCSILLKFDRVFLKLPHEILSSIVGVLLTIHCATSCFSRRAANQARESFHADLAFPIDAEQLRRHAAAIQPSGRARNGCRARLHRGALRRLTRYPRGWPPVAAAKISTRLLGYDRVNAARGGIARVFANRGKRQSPVP